MDEKFLDLLSDVMDTESELTADTVLEDIEEWDSLSVVNFVVMAKTSYGKDIKGSEVKKAQTVADLFKLVQG